MDAILKTIDMPLSADPTDSTGSISSKWQRGAVGCEMYDRQEMNRVLPTRSNRTNKRNHQLKQQPQPRKLKMMVSNRNLLTSRGSFSGAMLVSGRVYTHKKPFLFLDWKCVAVLHLLKFCGLVVSFWMLLIGYFCDSCATFYEEIRFWLSWNHHLLAVNPKEDIRRTSTYHSKAIFFHQPWQTLSQIQEK